MGQSTWGHPSVPDCSMLKTLLVLTVLAGLTNAGHPVCKIIWEDKCWDEPREQCSSVKVPYTTTKYEEKCTTVQVPKVETVSEEKCIDLPEEKCKTTTEKKCTKKYEQECTYKDEEVCRKVNKEKCDLIDDEVCESSADKS